MRRLFAENLAVGVSWKALKDLFLGRFKVLHADVVHVGQPEAFGILEFQSRIHARDACILFNGVLLEEQPIRLRQDRGEFDDLKALPPPLQFAVAGCKARRVEEAAKGVQR